MNCCYCVMQEAFNLSVCREDRHVIQTQSIIHCAHHRWKHRRTVFVGVFQRRRELFLSHIINGNTDEHISSMYSRGEGNCSQITDESTNGHKPSVYYRGEGNRSYIPDGNIDDLCPSVFFQR